MYMYRPGMEPTAFKKFRKSDFRRAQNRRKSEFENIELGFIPAIDGSNT